MIKLLPLILIFLIHVNLKGQNPQECDSLNIDCCTFSINGENTITLQVSNYSSNLFSYPGFILFNESMDTVAKEIVNYYGIGNYWQPHTLELNSEITLPFTGHLELHTGFYSSHVCSFPITVADTISVGIEEKSDQPKISVFPNPAKDAVNVYVDSKNVWKYYSIRIYDQMGVEVLSKQIDDQQSRISLSDWDAGIYYITISNQNGEIIKREKLILK